MAAQPKAVAEKEIDCERRLANMEEEECARK